MSEYNILNEHRKQVLRKVITAIQLVLMMIALGIIMGYFIQQHLYDSDNTNLDRIEVVQVTLDDTRRVPCVVQNGYICTCDWTHASGSDNLE